MKNILAIETSCDETAAAVVRSDLKMLSNVVYSQIALHQKTHGVVPEVASREHIIKIIPIIQQALKKARVNLEQIDVVAVTSQPGLPGSLLIGQATAQALAWALKKPLKKIDHVFGHLVSPLGQPNLKPDKLSFPILGLTASGGHTQLIILKTWHDYQILGQTLDDAAGEAFDKIATLLGLPYPGGPELEKLAQKAENPGKIKFPSPKLTDPDLNFSFSGLKTSVRYFLKNHPQTNKTQVAWAAQNAIIRALIEKAHWAQLQTGAKTIFITGGVSANQTLQKAAQAKFKKVALHFPPKELMGDNAAMVGLAAAIKLNYKQRATPF